MDAIDADSDIQVGPVTVPRQALSFQVSRGGGPGGQNVNKVASRVQLKVDLYQVMGLPDYAADKLASIAASRITKEGELQIVSGEHRDQLGNKSACLHRLVEILKQCLHRDKPRRATKPSKGQKERRLKEKKHRGDIKKMRGSGD